MLFHPYFILNGQAREAIDFYCASLSLSHGEIKTYGTSPVPHLPEQKDWVMHAELLHENKTLAMIADSPDISLGQNQNIHLSINYSDLSVMKNAFEQLSQGGKITMPLEKQFWNATFGQLIDRFGIHWMMNCDHHQ